MARLGFSPQAQRDLIEIGAYIVRNSPRYAARFVERLNLHCDLIATHPLIGRSRDEVRPGLRSISYGRYAIFYRFSDEAVDIVRVIHSARDLDHVMGSPAF